MNRLFACIFIAAALGCGTAIASDETTGLDVSEAILHLKVQKPDVPTRTALRVLREEVEKRTGLRLEETSSESRDKVSISLMLDATLPAESYQFVSDSNGIRITGADARGLLYGVGYFLRRMDWGPGRLQFSQDIKTTSQPAYPIRGHQLGYRYQANSYDVWSDAQYEQYIRELALFGANSIENIPFQDHRDSPHMKLDRRTMNRRISEICANYGLDYWVWTPAEFDLSDQEKRSAHLAEHKQLYRDCPTLTGVFFPGGDPGANPPELVLPFLEEASRHLRKYHPNARVWLSLQWFNENQCDAIYAWIDRERPQWLGGLVAGPSSPPIPETRTRLVQDYPLRDYPDITHSVRCQYPVPWWDPAYAVTLGRECINPRPVFSAFMHNYYAPYTQGFISYSDGIHDDVNKTVWSQRAWNPDVSVREILLDYCRFFFGASHTETITDGILALEKNWEGPLAENGSVTATLELWQTLERALPAPADNWRWQTLLVRAYYDAYTRYRLHYETALEQDANVLLAQSRALGAENSMHRALEIMRQADEKRCRPDLLQRIETLFDQLFHSIGLKSSVEKYQASGYERGCSLDFLNYPLNNRWWLEDEFNVVRALATEEERCQALEKYAFWISPGSGSFYDNLGHPGQSPHIKHTEGVNTDPLMVRHINPGLWWWDNGFSRKRLSWQVTLDYPFTLEYHGLDPDASYLLRLTGYGEARPRANGFALVPSINDPEFKEFPIPATITASGELTLVFDRINESHLNWRQQSRIAEAWLIKK